MVSQSKEGAFYSLCRFRDNGELKDVLTRTVEVSGLDHHTIKYVK